MLERDRLQSKKISKTQSVTSQMGAVLPAGDVHVGPSDFVPWLADRKFAHIRMEGTGFGGVPLNLELKLEVWDSPELGRDRHRCGPLREAGAGPRHRRRAGRASQLLHEIPTAAIHRCRSPHHDPSLHYRRGLRRVATTILLIRHAEHELLGRVLCGRTPGVQLGERGWRQARHLGARLQREGLAAPLHQPARPCTGDGGGDRAAMRACPDRGRGLRRDRLRRAGPAHPSNDLDLDPAWERWNVARAALASPPEGESMVQAQARAVAGVRRIEARHPDAAAAVVSHGDVIKAILAWCLRLPLDAHARFEISPARSA